MGQSVIYADFKTNGIGKVLFKQPGTGLLFSRTSQELPIPFDLSPAPFDLEAISLVPFDLEAFLTLTYCLT